MHSLRNKIEELLLKEHYTFSQLAEYLNLSEEELADGLEHKTLELRYLEEISKNLKVPLYSFFRAAGTTAITGEKPFYTNRLWDDDHDKSPQKLNEEIDLLKKAIARKEAELAKKTNT